MIRIGVQADHNYSMITIMINSMITLITMIIKTQIYDNHLVRRLMVSARTWCTEVARLLVDLQRHCYQYLDFVCHYCYYHRR